MKRAVLTFICLLLLLTSLLALPACDAKKAEETTTILHLSESTQTTENIEIGFLYAVIGEVYQFEFGYFTDKLTVERIAEAFSGLTGLNFSVSAAKNTAESITVDWKTDSTLVAGIGEQTQKEGFVFYDVESLDWFMLNSLCRTIRENMGNPDVYYTMNGGEPLELEGLPGVSFSPGIAYNNLDNPNVKVTE